jgi:hypothetical protein
VAAQAEVPRVKLSSLINQNTEIKCACDVARLLRIMHGQIWAQAMQHILMDIKSTRPNLFSIKRGNHRMVGKRLCHDAYLCFAQFEKR